MQRTKWALALCALVLVPGVQSNPGDPLPPWGLTAETTDSGVQLSWSAPVGAVDSYNVYRADDVEAVAMQGMDAFLLVGQTTDTAFLDTPDGSAIYVVTAFHDGDESPPSNSAGYPYCLAVSPGCFLPPPWP